MTDTTNVIPEDVMEAAENALFSLRPDDATAFNAFDRGVIARAILAERERTAARLDRLEAAEAERDAARALLKRAGDALAWTGPMAAAIAGFERDCDDQFPDDFEVGRIDESRDSSSFRIRIGHLRAARAIHAEIKEAIDD